MKKKFLLKPSWDFYNSFPSLWDRENFWDSDEFQSIGLSIYEDQDNVFFEAPLPGVPLDDIELNFENGRLSIEGEKKEDEKRKKYHKKSTSSFFYQSMVPDNVDHQKEPEASYKDGVLTVKFSKNGKKKKTIPIKDFSEDK
ncbi:MAG: Hsp20/alpha crystallin family protein [Simkaniaceae bacterium]|nr:MAG: Hsp20/alpha crystallin family protein [Simkaniaceae bacterium]